MSREAFESDPGLKGLIGVPYEAYVPGVQATDLYRTMMAPLAPFALRGFLWYQGEANCMCAEGSVYTDKMRALIASWRAAWGDPSAPFLFVQLPPFDYSRWDKFPRRVTPEELPLFRDAQTRALSIPHTGMVVTTDLVTNTHDIHPTDKRDVGLRLARLALARTYGRKRLLAESPQLDSMRFFGGGKVELRFAHAGSGLAWRDGKPSDDFSIAGVDRHFVPATGKIRGDTVIVATPGITAPAAVRFGWNEVAMPRLVNSAGLPAVPFRTDDWPVEAERPPESAAGARN
jgi:sialate O-acetylesterase